jgi:hypothetical protein
VGLGSLFAWGEIVLKITVELCPPHGPSRVLGYAEIENISDDEKFADYGVAIAKYGDYAVSVFEGKDEHEVGTATLTNYPRFAGTVWDLVARGVATVACGQRGTARTSGVPMAVTK